MWSKRQFFNDNSGGRLTYSNHCALRSKTLVDFGVLGFGKIRLFNDESLTRKRG